MNKIVSIVVGFVVVSAGAFYAGIQYQNTKAPTASLQQSAGGQQQGGFGGRGGMRGNGMGGGPSGGEIIAKDDTSVTVKLRDGGSKIIFYSPSTSIMKSDAGAAKDLVIGEQIIANGTANADGSITAQSIQIRPAQVAKPVPPIVK